MGCDNALAASVKELDAYVKESDSGISLEAPADILAGLPEEHVNELRVLIAKKNEGAWESSEAEGAQDVTIAATWRGEHGYLKSHWYGWELGMDGYLAGKVLAGVFGVAAVCTAIGVSTKHPAAGVIAAAFGLLGAMIMACKHKDGWTYIYLLGMPPFTPSTVVCNPFG